MRRPSNKGTLDVDQKITSMHEVCVSGRRGEIMEVGAGGSSSALCCCWVCFVFLFFFFGGGGGVAIQSAWSLRGRWQMTDDPCLVSSAALFCFVFLILTLNAGFSVLHTDSEDYCFLKRCRRNYKNVKLLWSQSNRNLLCRHPPPLYRHKSGLSEHLSGDVLGGFFSSIIHICTSVQR